MLTHFPSCVKALVQSSVLGVRGYLGIYRSIKIRKDFLKIISSYFRPFTQVVPLFLKIIYKTKTNILPGYCVKCSTAFMCGISHDQRTKFLMVMTEP